MMSLWTQHRDRWEVGGITLRRITYFDFRRITDGALTDEELAAVGRLNAKQASGATLTPEETARLADLAGKWPVDELKAACLVPPVTDYRGTLAGIPHADALIIDDILTTKCIVPEIPEKDIADPLAVVLVASGGLGIDAADMTAGQGMAVVQMLTPKKEGSE